MEWKASSARSATGRLRGNHICWTYDSAEDRERVLTDFLMDGIARGERTVYYGVHGGEDEVAQRLADAGLDITGLGATNQLRFGDATDAYMPGGVFDPDERLAEFEAAANAAIAEGFTGLRVAAENTWLLDDPDVRRAWPAYELRADLLTARMPIVGLCGYDLNEIHHEAVPLIAALHRSAIGAEPGGSQFHVHASAPGALMISGRLDEAHIDEVQTAVLRALGDLTLAWVDVTDLDFADLAGMRLISRLADAFVTRGDLPVINGTTPAFRQLWRTYRVDDRADVILN